MNPVDFVVFGGDSDPNMPVRMVADAMQRQVRIVSADSEWKVLSYYYDDGQMVLEIDKSANTVSTMEGTMGYSKKTLTQVIEFAMQQGDSASSFPSDSEVSIYSAFFAASDALYQMTLLYEKEGVSDKAYDRYWSAADRLQEVKDMLVAEIRKEMRKAKAPPA